MIIDITYDNKFFNIKTFQGTIRTGYLCFVYDALTGMIHDFGEVASITPKYKKAKEQLKVLTEDKENYKYNKNSIDSLKRLCMMQISACEESLLVVKSFLMNQTNLLNFHRSKQDLFGEQTPSN